MSKKRLPAPRWWKNTFFWIAGLMVIVAIVGLFRGTEVIRDPGQTDEGGLLWIYLGGAIAMLVNGYMTHSLYKKRYAEENEEE